MLKTSFLIDVSFVDNALNFFLHTKSEAFDA